jgi:hypothetical protein
MRCLWTQATDPCRTYGEARSRQAVRHALGSVDATVHPVGHAPLGCVDSTTVHLGRMPHYTIPVDTGWLLHDCRSLLSLLTMSCMIGAGRG